MILTEELLSEILDSNFEVHRDPKLESQINHELKDKIHSGHTAVMQSDHMKKQGHSVIKMMNRDKHIEYHFSGEKMDQKSMYHSMKIIHDDAEHQIKHGRSIKLQANTKDQHKSYHNLASRLIKNHNHLHLKDVGDTEKLDGTGKAKTHIIEDFGINAPAFSDFINKLRKKYEN